MSNAAKRAVLGSIAAGAFLILVRGLIAAPVPARIRGGPELTLSSQGAHVRALDPLLLRFSLWNDTAFPISLTYPLSFQLGTVVMEVRRPGDRDFTEVRTCYSGSFGCCVPGAPTVIRPNERYGGYACVFADGVNRFVFSQPGEYEVRALALGNGKSYYSTPVKVNVSSVPDVERGVIESNTSLLVSHIGVRTPLRPNNKGITRVESAIGTSNLKYMLESLVAIDQVFTATGEVEKERAMRYYHMIKGRRDVIAAAVMDVSLADWYANAGKWKDAERILSAIGDQSCDRDSLLVNTRHHLRDGPMVEKGNR